MQTLVVSDLHLGPGGQLDIFAGEATFPPLLDGIDGPVRVVLNGDTLDFLLDDEPLELDVERACRQASAIVSSKASLGALGALARVTKRGGEVIVRPGNHDLELAIPEVQAVLRGAITAAGGDGGAVSFDAGEVPAPFEVGGRKILITHGEHDDPFNTWQVPRVLARAARANNAEPFAYPPGSLLVKAILNRLKRKLRFVDLLKPDFHGAVLTALAVRPMELRAILRRETLEILRGVVANAAEGAAFAASGATVGAASDADGFGRSVAAAGLAEGEAQEIDRFLAGEDDASYGVIDEVFGRALGKLGRAGLRLYARTHRWLAGSSGSEFFDEAPTGGEWADATRLAGKFGVDVVIAGHTHARRRREEAGLTYVNTGTWIHLMQLPTADAPVEEWTRFLSELRADPMLASSTRLHHIPTACLVGDDGRVELLPRGHG
jgi:UDP-2,3-diacylglucosamine pyrophosphatase LpxH